MPAGLDRAARWCAYLIGCTALGVVCAPDIGVRAQQVPVFRAGVDLVRLQVTASDADGRPVYGLTASDFVVLEDGVVRPVVSFEAVDHNQVIEPAPDTALTMVRTDVADNRTANSELVVVLAVDEALPAVALKEVKQLARAFVDRLAPDVAIALVSHNELDEVEFTTDRALIRTRIDQVTALSAIRPRIGMTTRAIVGTCPYQKFTAVGRALKQTPVARKALVYVSPYCSSSFEESDLGRTMVKVLREANVSLYGLDPRGPQGYSLQHFEPPDLMSSQGNEGVVAARKAVMTRSWDRVLQSQQALIEATTAAGGFAITNEHQTDEAMSRLIDALGHYYVLGFVPGGSTRARGLEVKAANPAITLHYHRGYEFDGDSVVPGDRDVLEALSASAIPSSSLPLSITAITTPDRAKDTNVAVAIDVDLGSQGQAPEGPTDAEVFLVAADLTKEKITTTVRFEQPMIMDPATDTTRYRITGSISLPPGTYQLRAAVRLPDSGRSGSVYLPLDIPKAPGRNEVAMGTMALSTRDADSGVVDPLSIYPTLDRELHVNSAVRVFCQAVAGNPGAKWSARLTLTNEKGKVVKTSKDVQLSGPILVIDQTFDLSGVPDGAYVLNAIVKSGRVSGTAKVPLRITSR